MSKQILLYDSIGVVIDSCHEALFHSKNVTIVHDQEKLKQAIENKKFDALIVGEVSSEFDNFSTLNEQFVDKAPLIIGLVPISTLKEAKEQYSQLTGNAYVLTRPLAQKDLRAILVKEFDPSLASTLGLDKANESNEILEDEFRGLKILLAEDNEINQKYAVGVLDSLGVDITIANDGQIALDLLAEQKFDLVFMDFHMPRMDGPSATQAYRSTESNKERLPIIALTASGLPSEVQKCLDSGMDEVLLKPFKSKDIQQVLRTWLKGQASIQREEKKEIHETSNEPLESAYEKLEEAELVDSSMIVEWKEALDADKKMIYDEMIIPFKMAIEEGINKMIAAYRSQDYSEIKTIAHKAVGTSGIVGAALLGQNLREIENLEEFDPVKLSKMLEKAIETYKQTLPEIQRIVEGIFESSQINKSA